MRPTRRSWGVSGLTLLTAVLAVVFAQPLLLGATVMIGAWFIARQYRFLQELSTTMQSLSVEQSPESTEVHMDGSTVITLAVSRQPTSLSLDFEAGVPPSVTRPESATAPDSPTLSLEPGTANAARTITVTCPVAGRHSFEPATLTATDGWFQETVPVGQTPTITVEPRSPRDVHVGSGGDRIALAQGEHDSERRGSGLTPAELREYVPGDTADKIDWKATARLGSPHIREYEAETDRPAILIVDHRHTLATGPPDVTKLDYLKEAALAVASSSRKLGDPVGLVTVGDVGITDQFTAATDPTQYQAIRRALLDLEPTTMAAAQPPTTGQPRETQLNPQTLSSAGGHPATLEPTAARRALSTLPQTNTDTFVQTLRPFYEERQTYRKRFESDPLFQALQATLKNRQRRTWTVLCTDDSNPIELRESIQFARENGSDVLVLLAPTALFEPGSLTNLERTYNEYLSFEEFRRDLDRLDGVTALEVTPGDRMATVLAAGRNQTRTATPAGEHE